MKIFPRSLDEQTQRDVLEAVRSVVARAPLYHPMTARGRRMSVAMTSAGQFGWVTDRKGYRYETEHPETGQPWPDIPELILRVWQKFAGEGARAPESCLINFYGEGARMGLHQDRDEADFDQPVVSMSLGDEGLFRVGGLERRGPTKSVWLNSGDIAVLSGSGRLAYHGVDRIRFGSSNLLSKGGRLNLTLRVVT